MSLPRRAASYVHELRRRGILAETIRSTLGEMRRFGAGGLVRHALDLLGVESYMRVRYPATGMEVRVRGGPFWKYWRSLEAGTEDLANLRFLASLLKAGQTVLDVGAWEGPYTLLFAALVGAAGRVYAFEPDPRAARRLRSNVAANGLANVTVDSRCLSDSEGSAAFFDSKGGTIGSLVPNELVAGLPRVRVATTTIDRYCGERGLSVDGLKVDVEGGEALVLAGAEEVLARSCPWVFLEFHGVFMSPAVRERTWAGIVERARHVTFVAGKSERYRAGDSLDAYPDCDYFHALIQY